MGVIKDFIESYSDWNDNNADIKGDIECIYKTVERCDRKEMVACDIRISSHYPQLFEVAGRYNLTLVPTSVVESYSEDALCQVLLGIAHYLKDCVASNNINRVMTAAAEATVKHIAKRGVEKLLGLE